MKRTEALKSLSREHHQALFIAHRLREEEGPDVLAALADFWHEEGRNHFRIEEEILIPGSGLPGPDQDAQVARLFDDHRQIRAQVKEILGEVASPQQQRELGTALAAHVRFEERELFPRIESMLTPEELDQLARQIETAEAEA